MLICGNQAPRGAEWEGWRAGVIIINESCFKEGGGRRRTGVIATLVWIEGGGGRCTRSQLIKIR